ncbi:MAG: hypothetical protein ACYC3X_30420 [Pirellulaceae bacterium]
MTTGCGGAVARSSDAGRQLPEPAEREMKAAQHLLHAELDTAMEELDELVGELLSYVR